MWVRTRTFEGHSNWVRSVSFSPDGTKVASGSYPEVKLWDVTSGECLQTLEGILMLWRVCRFPDGTKVASGSNDKTVKLWDVTSGECLQTLEGHSADLTSVSFSPDGTKVASGSQDKTVKLWDATSGELLQTLEGHSTGEHCVVFQMGRRLRRGLDNTVKLWDDEGSELRSFEGHFGGEECVVFSRWDEGCVGVWDDTVKLGGGTRGSVCRC